MFVQEKKNKTEVYNSVSDSHPALVSLCNIEVGTIFKILHLSGLQHLSQPFLSGIDHY